MDAFIAEVILMDERLCKANLLNSPKKGTFKTYIT